MSYWLHSLSIFPFPIEHQGTEKRCVIFSDGVMSFLINIHLSHCGTYIFPVQELKFPYVFYTLLYHKKHNNMMNLIDRFLPVSLAQDFLSLYKLYYILNELSIYRRR